MTYSKTKCSDEKLIEAAHREPTMAKAAARCGLHFTTFKRRALELGVYMPNQGSAGVKKGHHSTRIPTEEILEGKHPQYQTYKLRNRLIEESILGYKCNICGINDHMNLPLSLELDHINGDRRDHRLENLRLLCPNCHSQTPTYRSKKRSVPFVITDYLNSVDDIAAYLNAAIETGDEAVSKDKHPPECKWHKDWHACDCGAFDKEEK